MNITPKRTLSYFLCFIGITFLLNLACSKDAETLRDVVLSEENSPVIKQDDSTNNPDIPQIEDSVVVETEIRTAILYPIHDAYIQNGEGYDEPIIRLEEEQRTSYLMFDFSPLDSIGGSISTATLMFVINTDDGSGEVDVYKGESSNWLETNLSEKTAPDVGELIGVTKQEYIIDTEVSIDLEVEALELEPYTFILDHKDGDDFAFASKENKTQAGSSLIVVYEVAVDADDIDLYIVEPEVVISDTDNPIEEEEGTNEVVRDEGDGSEEETPSNEEEEEVIDSVEGDTPISEEVAEENENTDTEEVVVAEEQEADSEEGAPSNEEEVVAPSNEEEVVAEEESTDSVEGEPEEVTPTTEEAEPKIEEKETETEEETPVTEVPEDNTDTNINPLPSIPFPTNESPVAVANGSPINGEAPLKVSFNAIDSSDDKAIVSYAWDFKDGQTASTANPEHTFDEAGNYEVTLLIKDEEGISALNVIIIKVAGPANTAPIAKLNADKTSGTLPLDVTFAGSQSTDDTGITEYSWDFKDGNSSDESDPSHTFTTDGVYDVSLTVTDAEGLKNTETVSITVESKENVAPVAKLSADRTSGTVPLKVAFTGSGSTDDTGITGYSWDFKDGNSSDESDPSHTFGTAGTYEVSVTVTDAEGLKSTETISITVGSKENAAPVAKVSADKTSGTLPLVVAFTGSGSTDDTGITVYSWDFKDGNGSDQSNASHTFESAGTYAVALTVTDAEGLKSTETVSVRVEEQESSPEEENVDPLPSTPFPTNESPVAVANGSPINGEAPLRVSFSALNSSDDKSIVSYTWDFKDGQTAKTVEVEHTFDKAGNYEVTLVTTDEEGISDLDIILITVTGPENAAPVAKLSADKTSGTLPLAVSFTGSGSTDDTGITGYSWDFKDDNSSDESDPSHTFGTAGTYEVSLTVTDAEGLKSTETVSITVESKENVAPVAKLSADKTSGTLPLAVSFTGSGSTDDTGITGYSWDFKDGNSSDESDPSHTFGTAGTYEVSLTVTDAEGLKSTETVSIIVEAKENVAPVAKLSADKTSGTLPLAVSFTGSGSTDDTGITGYSWNFKDGNSSDESDPSHTFGTAGTYEVSLTVTDAEGLKSTETVSIIVEAKENVAPVAKLSADKTSGTLPLAVSFTGSGSTDDTGITGYSWNFKDGNGSEQSDATHTFETAGIYEVSLTVTDEEGLTSTSSLSINVIEAEVVGPLDCSTGGKTAGESGNKVWCWGDIAFPTWSGSSGVSFSDKQLYIDSQCDEQQVTKSGNRLKFSVNPNSPNVANWCSEDYNIRAEVRTEPWNVRHPKGTEEWFGWSYSFGNNYVIDENNEWLFFQVHPGISGKSPHTELMVNREGQYGGKAGEIYIVNHVNYPDYIATGIIPKAGETIDVVVHAIWGDSSNGLLEVWINGQKFYNKQTKTIYDSHPWGGNAKWGIYKWPWRDGDKVQKSVEQGASQLETYLGTVRMITRKPGDTDYGKDSYSMVAPN